VQLIQAYHLDPAKVRVSYEGVDKNLDFKASRNIQETLDKYQIKKPFLLYVGSVYPHKNVVSLIKAIKMINQPKINLVVVCARSVFWERLEKEVENLKAKDFVNLAGFVPDEELSVLYRQAEAFVFPSISEGFGLPCLEAMANGLPVLASDIPVFKEVYQKAALYFNPFDPEDISEKIKEFLLNPRLKDYLRSEGDKVVKLYSWEKMARETLDGYRSV
jgi:glycosyltransferase involved in cell wall biosynthesis